MTGRIALVHERFTEVAGAERVVERLAAQFPEAYLYAPIATESGIPTGLERSIETTLLDRCYRATGQKTYAPLMPLMPRSFRQLPLRDADLVIISHHAFAVQAAFATSGRTVAYVHTPARWAWDPTMRTSERGGPMGAAALSMLSSIARASELAAVRRLDLVLANSSAVALRMSTVS
ncbi:glycosyltransferase family 4 protein [Skermania sp. ID1734]|uniref:glycosyltransferase n=1 Tax=Skermania sp. ID1734 TaxID=2597516 RepID=UPI00117D7892|nr:glycosyltransferase [Skermania sp. ID1734]TSD93176.1 glycosyltransferase family 4 protein [Skermania sp. ID1734]